MAPQRASAAGQYDLGVAIGKPPGDDLQRSGAGAKRAGDTHGAASWPVATVEAPAPYTLTVRSHMSVEKHFAVAKFSPRAIKQAVGRAEGFNAKVAVIITRGVGTMACAYVFCLIALVSLPAILIEAGALQHSDVPTFLTKPGLILIVAWIAQTFIQLVLLSIIMVGQNVQSVASDARSEKTFEDAVTILDRLDLETEGGLKAVLDRINELAPVLKAATPGPGAA
ncbi:MAG: hypothetical protein ABSF58_06885 [Solirubrobacteraceae bacterium]